MSQIYRNLLTKIKKANKDRKLKLAIENGFVNPEDFINFLEANIEPKVLNKLEIIKEAKKRYKLNDLVKSMTSDIYSKLDYSLDFLWSYNKFLYLHTSSGAVLIYANGKWAETKSLLVPTIHIAYVLDSSGSMFNHTEKYKFHEAVSGIESEIRELKQDNSANYIISVYEFSHMQHTHLFQCPIHDINEIDWKEFKRTTTLNDTIFGVLTQLKEVNDKNIKVLIKVFTDGRDVGSRRKISTIAKKIKSIPNNWTFTFVAAESDKNEINKYNIDETNILYHTNTQEGVKESFAETRCATKSYVTNVIAGKDVSSGFYKEFIN